MATKPLVGVALGGGVIRGMAHIGVLKAFKKAGIPVHMIAGTSSGSIIAALYAAGYSPERMEEIALELKYKNVFDFQSTLINLLLIAGEFIANALHLKFPFHRPLGLMKGRKLETQLNRLLGKDRVFGDTKIPLGVAAVDTTDGALVIFVENNPTMRTILPPKDAFIKSEPIVRAVRASSSVPGIFEPVRIGKRILVDGGVRDNIPAYVLRRMGADFVISVDVGYDGSRSHYIGNIFDVLSQSFDILMSESINIKLVRYTDVVIRPVIKNMGPWDFHRIDYAIKRGELAAAKAVEQIKFKLDQLN